MFPSGGATTLIFIVDGAVAVVSFVTRSKASWNMFVPPYANRALPAHRQPDTFIGETSLARGTLNNFEIIEDTKQAVLARSGTRSRCQIVRCFQRRQRSSSNGPKR